MIFLLISLLHMIRCIPHRYPLRRITQVSSFLLQGRVAPRAQGCLQRSTTWKWGRSVSSAHLLTWRALLMKEQSLEKYFGWSTKVLPLQQCQLGANKPTCALKLIFVLCWVAQKRITESQPSFVEHIYCSMTKLKSLCSNSWLSIELWKK